MKNRILAIVVGGTIFASAVFAADSPKITANAAELNASELASALGVDWWSYKLRFDKPVSGVDVRLYELRRKPDDSWERTELSPGSGIKHENSDIRELPVAIFIPKKAPTPEFGVSILLGNSSSHSDLLKKLDFSRTYSQPTCATFVNGCIALAIEEKNPRVATGLEKNFVRIIGLAIETE